jgi:hypothetical protein
MLWSGGLSRNERGKEGSMKASFFSDPSPSIPPIRLFNLILQIHDRPLTHHIMHQTSFFERNMHQTSCVTISLRYIMTLLSSLLPWMVNSRNGEQKLTIHHLLPPPFPFFIQ